jgi:hemolysin III
MTSEKKVRIVRDVLVAPSASPPAPAASAPPSAAPPAARVKPRLRGVSHQIAAYASFVAVPLLVASAPTPRARLAALIYGAALVLLFCTSAIYHRPMWSPQALRILRRLDHSAIFVLIAGTYTPFCTVIGGKRGAMLLAVVWGGALLGVLRAVLWVRPPRAVVAGMYVALGWVIIPMLPAMQAAVGTWGVALIAGGGLIYSLGAVIYATRRPDPFPRVFGFHEVFHVLVIVAAACHFTVVASALDAIR